jgi:hypothetical protein
MGVENGFHTDDYNAAKENFASRSGLVSQNKLFMSEQAAEINAAIEYRIENDDSMNYEEERELKVIAAKLRTAYPGAATVTEVHDHSEPRPQEAREAGFTTNNMELVAKNHHQRDNPKFMELAERIDKNFADYQKSLEGFGIAELFDMAGRIKGMSDAHSYMVFYHNFTDDEINFYLKFENPLEIVGDFMTERNSDVGDVSFALQHIERPRLHVDVLSERQAFLPDGMMFAMKVDIGGRVPGSDEWVVGNDTWATTIFNPRRLPRSGF